MWNVMHKIFSIFDDGCSSEDGHSEFEQSDDSSIEEVYVEPTANTLRKTRDNANVSVCAAGEHCTIKNPKLD